MKQLLICGVLTKVEGFAHFTAIAPTTTTDSDCVVCGVEDIESVAGVLGSDIIA